MFPSNKRPVCTKSENDQRMVNRIRPEMLQSSVGRIHDLSETGMRVVCRREMKGMIEVAIVEGAQPIVVKANVVWIRRIGFDRFFAGLAFEGLRSEQRNRIRGLVHAGPQDRSEKDQDEQFAA